MNNPNKLYKCYKDGCSFRLDHEDGPFLTQAEYDIYVKDGSLVCPEDNLNCGLQELKEEDYPKQPGMGINKKLATIIGIAVCLCIAMVFGIKNLQKDVPKIEFEQPEQQLISNERPQNSNEAEKIEILVTEPNPDPATTPDPEPSIISFSELFKKIGNSEIPYHEKDALKNELIENYFKNDGALVVEVGKNSTEVGHTGIRDFLEELSQQNFNFEILEINPKSRKNIKTIKIRRN